MKPRTFPTNKRPTITDVARRAGIGIMTVSRVINGSHRVTEKTRKKVLAAIAEVGYKPNEAARLLKGQRARTIGLIVDLSRDDLSHDFRALPPASHAPLPARVRDHSGDSHSGCRRRA